MSGNKSHATQVVRRPLQCCFRCKAAEMQNLFPFLTVSFVKRTSGCRILSEQKKINKWSEVTGNSSSGFSLGADTNGQGHIYQTVFSLNVVLHGEGQDGMFALGEPHPSLSFRVTSDFQLIWGLTATHSKYTYNGSSWRDYEGCESAQLNGAGWRRWSSSLAWAFRLLQPLSVQSYVEGAMHGTLVVCTGLCSLRTPTHVFCQLTSTVPPVMDTQKAFGWVAGCRNPAPSFLWGLDYCAEIWVEWPHGPPLLSNCESFTVLTGQPLHPVHVYPVTGAKVTGGNPHVITTVIGSIFLAFFKCTLWHLTCFIVRWSKNNNTLT